MKEELTGVMIDKNGNVVPHTKCPRCGTQTRMVPLGSEGYPDRRKLHGVLYDMYQCVCIQCSLYFNEARVHVEK